MKIQILKLPNNKKALGGVLQTHGSDWSDGMVSINAGQTHELNPYDGVQLGTDSEGTPNLVEEGEVVFNDYVFSNRINIDATTKEKFHLPKKKDITYADLAKRLEKEISERVNDPISKAGFKAQMQTLEEQQERQKQEMEAQRAKEAFESLSPEEQVAVMQQASKQEAMAQQAAQEQQLAAEQQAAMQQQVQMQADGTEAMLGQEAPMMACGGKINRFDNGGQAYTKMINSLGFHTQKEFEDWAEENNIDFGDLWKDTPNTLNNDILSGLWKNENFKEALRKKNPALFHAFDTKGYDFGAYQPTNADKATIQSISKGNWKATNGKGWRGSEDLAFKQATEGLSDAEIDALTTEQLAERMKNTEAYKNTNKWLENADNALLYLNTLYNDPDTPQVAKDYAAKYIKDGKWKDGFNYDYATVFGSNGKGVRETNPGTYWHTAMEANRGNQAGNFVINEDGTVEPIVGDVPTNWIAAGNYSWATPENDLTYNYYRRPAAPATSKTPEEIEAEKKATKQLERKIVPIHDNTLFGIEDLGPLGAMGLMAAGVGKHDTASLDAAVNAANGPVAQADWMPIGDYMAYKPNDPWFYTSTIMAQANATQRAINNKVSPSKGAETLANSYNTMIALGKAQREQLDSNYDRYAQSKGFNRGTNQFNAQSYNQNQQFNADARNRARQYGAQIALQGAAQKMDADAGWYNSLYGNLNSINQNIAARRKENRQRNMIADMAATGIYGVINPDTFNPNGMLRWETDEEYQKRLARQAKSAACGGKLKKKGKRGLTF